MCLTLCPEVFEMTDDGWAVADPEEVPAGLETSAKDAIANCPEQAIREIEIGGADNYMRRFECQRVT